MADDSITDDRTTKDKATDVATTAKEQARGVAGDARHEAAAVVSEAGAQARNLVDEARTALRQQASDGTNRAAGAIDDLGTRFRALAQGDAERAGDLRRYADQMGERLANVADRVNERGVDGIVDDVQRFGRRRPGRVPGRHGGDRLRRGPPVPGGQGGRLVPAVPSGTVSGARGSGRRDCRPGARRPEPADPEPPPPRPRHRLRHRPRSRAGKRSPPPEAPPVDRSPPYGGDPMQPGPGVPATDPGGGRRRDDGTEPIGYEYPGRQGGRAGRHLRGGRALARRAVRRADHRSRPTRPLGDGAGPGRDQGGGRQGGQGRGDARRRRRSPGTWHSCCWPSPPPGAWPR